MDTPNLFPQYLDTLHTLPALDRHTGRLPQSLRLARDGELEVFYAPFDYINTDAKLVIVGITPGYQQAANALDAARRLLATGQDADTALRAAKLAGSFSGPLRAKLVALLDRFRVHDWLGIASCAQLFGPASHLVHFTSLLRYPVFEGGSNYNGSALRAPLPRQQFDAWFAREVAALPEACFVPLGRRVEEGLNALVAHGVLDESRVLAGLVHPSPENGERIAYLLGRKPRAELSAKTPADPYGARIVQLETRMRVLLGEAPVSTAAAVAAAVATPAARPRPNVAAPPASADTATPVVAPHPGLDDAEHVWVPVASDGSRFHPGLAKRGDHFTVGTKGEEVKIAGFEPALAALRAMPKARWRRPSRTTGTPGIVAAIGWTRMARRSS